MFKRSMAILAVGAVTALFVVPPAAAQDAEFESYGAGASAAALFISLAEQELTFSGTSAAVSSEPLAAADGQAVTTPLFSTPGAPVESSGAVVTGQDCILSEDLPAPINLAGLDISCVNTSAGVVDGSPEASSASDEIVLEVLDSELVDQLAADVLTPLLEQLLAGLDPLLDALLLDETVAGVVDLVLADLQNSGTVDTIEVAPTSSLATEVSSLATSQGVTVELFPDLLPGIGPLATVVVGDAFASAVADPATGEVTLDGQAAFLSVDLTGLEVVLTALIGQVDEALLAQLPPELGEILGPIFDQVLALLTGLDTQVEDLVNVTVDQLACPDSPLAALLCFSAGGVNELDAAGLEGYGFTYGDGTRGIEAEILGLSVLDGVLQLGVGQAAAGANAVLAQEIPRQEPPPAEPQAPLPRTGIDSGTPVALALFAAAAAGLAVVRRTRTTV
ncbi:MAG: hypothetical protein ACSLFP_13345 [Acidimicrobiales bacterium]